MYSSTTAIPPGRVAACMRWSARAGILDPLQRARRRHHVEAGVVAQLEDVQQLEGEIGDAGMTLAREPDHRLVAIDPEHGAGRSDGVRDPGGDGAGAGAHVEDRHAGSQDRRQPAVVARQRAPVEDARIGGVGLAAQASPDSRFMRRSRPSSLRRSERILQMYARLNAARCASVRTTSGTYSQPSSCSNGSIS